MTTSTPEPKTYERMRSTIKQAQKKRQVYDSDLDDQKNSEEEVKRKVKPARKRTRRDTSTRKNSSMPKTTAKDGRKLADVTNRLKDEKGRLQGYKPDLQPAKIL